MSPVRNRRRYGLGLATALAAACVFAPARADASVTWAFDTASGTLTFKATAGEPTAILCKDGKARTISGVVTTTSCNVVKSLVVNGANLIDDTLDVSLVTAATFPALTSITLYGKSGNDRLVGSPLNDIIFGNAGNDRVIGGAGDDILTGGDGNDRMTGGPGADSVRGANGDDILVGDDDTGFDLARDDLNGGYGTDTFVAHNTDTVKSPNDDPAFDLAKWSYLPQNAPQFIGNAWYISGRVDVSHNVPSKWTVSPGFDCCPYVLRGTEIATGRRMGLDLIGELTVTMSTGDDIATATVPFDGLKMDPVTLNAGSGTDKLLIYATDPTQVKITATQITYGTETVINVSGFESVKVFQRVDPIN